MCVVLIVFVMVPEVLAGFDPNDDRKVMLEDERSISKNFMTIWEFEGFMKYSPLFYGYYSTKSVKWGYKLPMAYFMTGLVVYVYSFVATLRK
jgi:transmembrane channel-like protein